MLQGLQKLKSKIELQPKYTVVQPQDIISKIYIFDCASDIDSDGIVQSCKKYQTEEYKEKKSTEAVYAWRSDYIYLTNSSIVEFDSLFQLVISKMESIDYGISFSRYNYIVDHFWFAIYNKGDNSKLHAHGWADFAAVYYAATPEKSAPLVIPSVGGDVTIVPKTGMLVIMPGLCKHEVPKSEHDGERIIVAMNLMKSKLKNL